MFVIEDVKTGRVVAAATLLLEYKFIHNAGKCGHVEDVVVDKNVRGRGLGKKIVGAVRSVLGCWRELEHQLTQTRQTQVRLVHMTSSFLRLRNETQWKQSLKLQRQNVLLRKCGE